MEAYIVWIAIGLLAIAALGTLLPVIPGLPLMAAVIIIYGWWEQFRSIDSLMITVTLVLTVLGSLLDYVSGPYTARRVGASKLGVTGAVLGAILGILVMGPIGLIAGPFAGAFIGEILDGQKLNKASKVGLASLLGTLLGSLVKLVFALIILVMFLFRVIQ